MFAFVLHQTCSLPDGQRWLYTPAWQSSTLHHAGELDPLRARLPARAQILQAAHPRALHRLQAPQMTREGVADSRPLISFLEPLKLDSSCAIAYSNP